jgi:hypothetical protein
MSDESACTTAFMVIQHNDGRWYATADIGPVTPLRTATVQEMKFGCGEVISDIEASKVAKVVMTQMMAATMQMREAAQAADLADRLKI